MGSQGQMGPSPGSYNFGAVYANSKVSPPTLLHSTSPHSRRRIQTFLQGTIDNEGSLSGRYNFAWSPKNTTKLAVQVSLVIPAPHDDD